MSGADPPPPGSVLRYAYLWADENAAGREEGRKDRPAVVLVTVVRAAGDVQILGLAVSHRAPRQPHEAVLFPLQEKRRLGLDDAPAWIVTSEGNSFQWPGPDIRPIPGRTSFVYGQISPALLRRVARSYLSNREQQRGRVVRRT